MIGLKGYGKTAYEAYCERTDGWSLVTGAKLPAWDGLDTKIQDAWILAAAAVIDAYSEREA